ncbi:hypothetical protein, partial [Candidatus Symbiopectobacterium sp. NZEC135]|uniref:hypothetical protein n=1 Tax=Candidatus Symbiopectobacterium sp. NZEC135 TaxID=2820471 RepID=UPI002226E4E1
CHCLFFLDYHHFPISTPHSVVNTFQVAHKAFPMFAGKAVHNFHTLIVCQKKYLFDYQQTFLVKIRPVAHDT